MIKESINNNVYTVVSGEDVLLTITKDGDTYTSKNKDSYIVAEVTPLDDYRTQVKIVTHKRIGKDGKYRPTTKLIQHNSSWLCYILQEIGFVRKAATV